MGLYNATNITGVKTMIEYVNSASEGYFSLGILISLYTIIFLSIGATGRIKEGAASAGFITLIAAILMRLMNLIPDYVLMVAIVIFFASIFMLFIGGKGD